MKVKSNKLKTKDLIVAGAFAALYVVVLMLSVSLMGITPITYLIAPLVISIVLGPIYILYVTKIPKTGAIIILSALVGLLTSMGGMWLALVWSLALGVAAELIVRAGKYRSKKLYLLSFCVFACANMGPFWAIVLAKPAFLASCESYYGVEYALRIDAFTPGWIILVLIGLALVGGLIGGVFGMKLMKKHFEKAEVV